MFYVECAAGSITLKLIFVPNSFFFPPYFIHKEATKQIDNWGTFVPNMQYCTCFHMCSLVIVSNVWLYSVIFIINWIFLSPCSKLIYSKNCSKGKIIVDVKSIKCIPYFVNKNYVYFTSYEFYLMCACIYLHCYAQNYSFVNCLFHPSWG